LAGKSDLSYHVKSTLDAYIATLADPAKDLDRDDLFDAFIGAVYDFYDGSSGEGDPDLVRASRIYVPGIMDTDIADTAWHYVGDPGEPAFGGTWTNHGSSWQRARFRKDAFGVVFISGLVTGGADVTTVFTLPAGYRPDTYGLHFPAAAMGDSVTEAAVFNISAAGIVQARSNLDVDPNGWVSLECSFHVGL
jgi:hypothetical protein